jgi:hypothetical protein
LNEPLGADAGIEIVITSSGDEREETEPGLKAVTAPSVDTAISTGGFAVAVASADAADAIAWASAVAALAAEVAAAMATRVVVASAAAVAVAAASAVAVAGNVGAVGAVSPFTPCEGLAQTVE